MFYLIGLVNIVLNDEFKKQKCEILIEQKAQF